MSKRTIAIGGDHAGYLYKESIKRLLEAEGFAVIDTGTNSTDSVDYPDYIHPLAEAIDAGKAELGIIICGSGNGVAMTANKHQNIRAAIAWNQEIAALARQHNNANVLSIPARFVSERLARMMVRTFLKTKFEGGRHARRVGKIAVC